MIPTAMITTPTATINDTNGYDDGNNDYGNDNNDYDNDNNVYDGDHDDDDKRNTAAPTRTCTYDVVQHLQERHPDAQARCILFVLFSGRFCDQTLRQFLRPIPAADSATDFGYVLC